MKALLLSAGLGTRLRPITDTIPKCLVPIHGKPLIEYWLEMLVEGGVFPILVNLHYFSGKVLEHLKTSKYFQFVETVYEDKLLGTGGTLLKNRLFFNNEPVMLIHGDNLSSFQVKSFLEAHRKRPAYCDMTMMLFHTATPESCGIVELNAQGVVVRFHEKVKNPPGNLANGAVYILEPSVITYLETLGKENIDFSLDVIPRYLGKIATYINATYHRDIGTVESYRQAERDFTV